MNSIKSAWHHLRRSPIQSLTALMVTTVTFFSFTVFAIVSDGLSSVLQYFETRPEITIFLKDGLDRVAVESLQKELANYPNIREIKFISKEKALSIYKELNKNNPMLTEMVTASILPSSFEVSVTDPLVLEQIATNFSAKTNVVDEIIYQKDVIQSLLHWTNVIKKAGFIIVTFSCSVSFFIILIIVGMKITNRKEEIRISRLLGASKFYVKKPFLLEGFFYGFLGSFIGSAIGLGLSFHFQPQLNSFFQPIVFIRSDLSFYWQIIFIEIVAGSFFGLIPSWIGVRRYIKF